MIVLDTNVVSEIYRPSPSTVAMKWLNAQPWHALFLCTPVLAELRFGVERLPSGVRKVRLDRTIDRLHEELFLDRMFVFDVAAALEYGRLKARRQRAGRPLAQIDGMIAAIALAQGAALATRDVGDFADLGLELIDPFAAPVT